MKTNKKRIAFISSILVFAFLVSGILASCAKDAAVTSADGIPGATTPTTHDKTTVPITTVDEGPIVLPVFQTVGPKVDYYQNPVVDDDKVNPGDPFVMRYDGKYYLYTSTPSNSPIYVRTSTDLVNWSDKIICTSMEEFPSEKVSAYAPEVTYYNGKFYMVTSLSGGGHYTFVAESPLGPFECMTNNWGLSIDGSIFIDNDGKWYFYSASLEGIKCYPMESPLKVDSESPIITGAIIDEGGEESWTEGPMVIYHDGTYYITYTGNHVSSDSYRIEYAYSTKNPTRFSGVKDKLLLISTMRDSGICATGHSSTVKGPDLDSYYIVYHTRNDRGSRSVNVDRLFFNGSSMKAMGPTGEDSQICFMPDIYAFFDDNSDAEKFDGSFTIEDGLLKIVKDTTVISKDFLKDENYTAELTVKDLKGSGRAGLIFGYKDENNYGSALFDTAEEKLVITFVTEGKKTEHECSLVRSFDMEYNFGALQSIQVEKKGNEFTFFVNDRELCKEESTLSGNKIGVKSEGIDGSFGYIGASDEVGGSSNKEHYKPVSVKAGLFLATHCLEKNVTLGSIKKTGEQFVVLNAGASLNYRLDAEKSGRYDFAVYYSSLGTAALELFVNGKSVGEVDLLQTPDEDEFTTAIFRSFEMEKGQNILTVYVKSGKANLLNMDVSVAEEVKELTNDFSEDKDENVKYHDGAGWSISEGVLKAEGAGRRTYGNQNWGDYSISVDVTPTGSIVNFGIILRVDDPGVYTKMNSDLTTSPTVGASEASADWMKGYYIKCSPKSLSIYKCSYSSAKRFDTQYKFESGKTYNLKAECQGSTIRVYVDGELIAEIVDREAIVQGMPGIRVTRGSVVFDNLEIKKIN